MSDELEELEPVEETPLSAEELFEQHKAEIEAAFEEKGFFRRLGDMFAGLSRPKSSPEYKLAKVELQRLAAPLLAILLPTLGVISLIVITAVSSQQKDLIQVDIAKVQEEDTQLEEEEEEIIEETPPDEVVDVQVDTPVVGPSSDVIAPSATVSNEPVSVKPAAEDSVALIKSPVQMKSMAGSRSPGMRGQFLRGGGSYGDAKTEGAVLKALRWLKKTQKSDGSWEGGTCPLANTALAVLAYLAHGETPSSEEFGPTVESAMQHLINALKTKNDKTGKEVPSFVGTDQNEYATLIATYALCEAYGMTKNPNTKQVAMQTLQRIVDGQSPTGGWDYGINPTSERDDMSFAGWALQALKAGKMAGLRPEGLDACIKKAIKCLKTRNFKNGGFNYTAGGNPTGLTSTGCLCMQLLGYMNESEVRASLDSMRAWKPVFDSQATFQPGGPTPTGWGGAQYYCYYAAQCKYQAGMCAGADPKNLKAWQDWNLAMKELYPPSIITLTETILDAKGKPQAIGYWDQGHFGQKFGAPMNTCLIALQLMVYYRYLPTTQTAAAKVETHDDDVKNAAAKEKEVDVDVDI